MGCLFPHRNRENALNCPAFLSSTGDVPKYTKLSPRIYNCGNILDAEFSNKGVLRPCPPPAPLDAPSSMGHVQPSQLLC